VESENPLAEVEPERPAKDKPEGKDSGPIL